MLGLDFFCGAGGTTRGLLDAGIDIIGGFDTDETARNTYQQNTRPNGALCKFIRADVANLPHPVLDNLISFRGDQPLLFTGCPPCQPFTNLKTNKENQGESAALLTCFLSHILEHRPEYVMVENVPGIRQIKYGSVFDDFVDALRDAGYHVAFGVLNAKDFGVPQSRRRMVLLGSQLSEIRLPEPTHGPRTANPYENASAAFRYPPIVAGSCHLEVMNHQAALLTDINERRIQSVAPCGGSRCDWPDELLLPCYREHDGHTDVYGRMNPNRPAPTLTTRFNSLSNGRFGHPYEHRAISLREGAALQTFSDDYMFYGPSSKHVARHIGNAVPVRLAQVLGNSVLAHYQQLTRDALPQLGDGVVTNGQVVPHACL